jgi:hypothetical protein
VAVHARAQEHKSTRAQRSWGGAGKRATTSVREWSPRAWSASSCISAASRSGSTLPMPTNPARRSRGCPARRRSRPGLPPYSKSATGASAHGT